MLHNFQNIYYHTKLLALRITSVAATPDVCTAIMLISLMAENDEVQTYVIPLTASYSCQIWGSHSGHYEDIFSRI